MITYIKDTFFPSFFQTQPTQVQVPTLPIQEEKSENKTAQVMQEILNAKEIHVQNALNNTWQRYNWHVRN